LNSEPTDGNNVQCAHIGSENSQNVPTAEAKTVAQDSILHPPTSNKNIV
jgi:hypothetical protein